MFKISFINLLCARNDRKCQKLTFNTYVKLAGFSNQHLSCQFSLSFDNFFVNDPKLYI